LILFILWTAATAVTQVQPGERAVVRRLGRLLDHKPGPGLLIGLPWGLDQVERVPIGRVRRVLVGLLDRQVDDEDASPSGQLITGDHNLVNVQVEVNYTVREEEVEKYAFQAERADLLVARATETILAEWIAGRKVDDVLLHGTGELSTILVEAVEVRLKPYQLGVRIEQASVKRLAPPDEVKTAFEKVAQADIGKDTQINQAKQQADRRRRDALAEKFSLERKTAAYAREQRLQAQADANTFLHRLAQYRKLRDRDPDYLNRLWLDEITRLYTRMKEAGRIDLLDHFLTSEGLTITQFPLAPKKK
jgi:membrane protease subunit HflK